MRFDTAAEVRCWRVDVDVGPHTLTIPALPARPWMVALLTGGWSGVITDLVPDVPDEVDEAIVAGTIRPGEFTRAARAAYAAAAGCKWWTAQRLTHACVGTALGAELALRAADPDRMPLAAYLHAGYQLAVRDLKDARRSQVDAELMAPPVDVDPADWFDRREAAANFMAVMARGG